MINKRATPKKEIAQMINKRLQQKSPLVKKKTRINSKRLSEFKQKEFSPLVEPIEYLTMRATGSQQSIFNYIAGVANSFAYIFPAQGGALARYGDCTRETVNRNVKVLAENGFIAKYRRYNDTCLYRISPLFHDLEIRKKLAHIIPSFAYLPLMLLLPFMCPKSTIKSANVTSKQRDLYIYKDKKGVVGHRYKRSTLDLYLARREQSIQKQREIDMKKTYMGTNAYNSYKRSEMPKQRTATSKNYGYSPYDRVQFPKEKKKDELDRLIDSFRDLKQKLVKSKGKENEFIRIMRVGWRNELKEVAEKIAKFDRTLVDMLIREGA